MGQGTEDSLKISVKLHLLAILGQFQERALGSREGKQANAIPAVMLIYKEHRPLDVL